MCTIAAFSAHERRFMANDNFIMLPTVDFCFNNLMQNSKVRRGFIAALLKVSPSEIEDTCILPTLLPRDAPDDKLGILDFIHFPGDSRCYRSFHFRDDRTGSLYTDKMELQILELKKLTADMHTEEDIIAWMKFFNGKDRKEFERMAKTNEYLDEAYHTLVNLSADEQKRLEYEAREKLSRIIILRSAVLKKEEFKLDNKPESNVPARFSNCTFRENLSMRSPNTVT